MVTSDVTGRIAEFIAATPFDALPEEAVAIARRMLVDVVGVSIAGAANEQFDCIHEFGDGNAAPGVIPGPRGRRYDPSWAALLIGTAAHLLDYDDVQTTMGGHPSVTLFPVVCALGYHRRSSGPDVLRAFVLGTEIETRLGRGMNPGHYVIGWHPTAVIGSIGAAAAGASLLGLDPEATSRALGIAASYAGGMKANFGSSVKSLHVGLTGRAGVEAALLAGLGATANNAILDRQFGGFFDLFAPDVNVDLILDDLGKRYEMAEAGVSFKLLPCCGSTHSATWAAIALHDENGVPPDRIKEIRVFLDPKRVAHTDRAVVQTGLQAKFSAQYCQAVGAIQGHLSLRDFEDDVVREPVRQAVLRRVRLIPSADLHTRGPAETSSTGSRSTYVEIEDVDGAVFGHFQPAPRGYASLPPSDADMAAKFMDCVAAAGPRTRSADDLLDSLGRIDEADDIRPVLADIWDSREV
jgi:2-methylcitrate dehydratase PrpD